MGIKGFGRFGVARVMLCLVDIGGPRLGVCQGRVTRHMSRHIVMIDSLLTVEPVQPLATLLPIGVYKCAEFHQFLHSTYIYFRPLNLYNHVLQLKFSFSNATARHGRRSFVSIHVPESHSPAIVANKNLERVIDDDLR